MTRISAIRTIFIQPLFPLKAPFLLLFFRISQALCDIMALILFSLTLLCTSDIALNLLSVEVNFALNQGMLNVFINFLMVFALTFAHYFLSEYVTADLLEIGEIFYNSAWYQLPVKHQRLLALPIERAQREVRLKNVDLFDCSLAIFSSVKIKFNSFVSINGCHF